MTQNDYEKAQSIKERIRRLDNMEAELKNAALQVMSQYKKSDADALAALFLNLTNTIAGKNVIEEIVGTLTTKFNERRRELEKEFAEL